MKTLKKTALGILIASNFLFVQNVHADRDINNSQGFLVATENSKKEVKYAIPKFDDLRFREQPMGKKVGYVEKNKKYEIISSEKDSNGNLWYKIKVDGKLGYISSSKEYVELSKEKSKTKSTKNDGKIEEYITRGWKNFSGKWYYYDVTGKYVTNKWVENYYLGENGQMLVDTTTPDGYRVDETGKWVEEVNWEKSEKGIAFKDANGKYLIKKWRKIEGYWYYFNEKGYRVENQWVGNYYLGKNGQMLVNTTTPDGYKVNKNGMWIKDYKQEKKSDEVRTASTGTNNIFITPKHDDVRFRETPMGKKIGYVEKNKEYKVISLQKDSQNRVWYKVESEGKFGYVCGLEELVATRIELEKTEKVDTEKVKEKEEKKENKKEEKKEEKVEEYFTKDYLEKQNSENNKSGKLEGIVIDSNGVVRYYNVYTNEMVKDCFFYDRKSSKGYIFDSNGVGHLSKFPREDFIKFIKPYMIKAIEGTGLFPSVAIAQTCVETGYGFSSLGVPPVYNLFGIKAKKSAKPSEYVLVKTKEYSGSRSYQTNDKFRRFKNYDEAFEYYANLFTKTRWLRRHYKAVIDAKTPEEQAQALIGRYATDPNYARKLMKVIEEYNLKEYDKLLFPNGKK